MDVYRLAVTQLSTQLVPNLSEWDDLWEGIQGGAPEGPLEEGCSVGNSGNLLADHYSSAGCMRALSTWALDLQSGSFCPNLHTQAAKAAALQPPAALQEDVEGMEARAGRSVSSVACADSADVLLDGKVAGSTCCVSVAHVAAYLRLLQTQGVVHLLQVRVARDDQFHK